MNPCGHQTRHTNRVGCCASCKRLFSSDSAFDRHRKGGQCIEPTERGLIAKASKTFPAETLWSLPASDVSWREEAE